ncbi:hypothetical protein [Phytomonospora endophytica]|uniref:Uncharacterized protein n=1 Tax=Phytomonospora endophytica TaxID=714109 RepID=A0A841G2L2_9ACTN|nr:hypothetical protein [Phytomonospora endophytica]MBB6039877.1 hypothetical protein [Phytomonospora endophytica]
MRHRRKSSRRVSRRAVAMTVSVLGLGGAMLLGTPFASAEETGDGKTITFDGGCGLIGLLAPSSTPDPSELEVPADTKVTFTNDLGSNAVLHVGATTVDVPKGESEVVTLDDKSVEVAMVPDCMLEHGLFEKMESATVTVKGSTTPPDEVDPTQPPGDNGDGDGNGNGSGSGSGSGDDKPGDAPDTGNRPEVDTDRPAADGAVPPDAGGNAPADGSTPAAPVDGNTPGAGSNSQPGSEFAVEPVGGDVTNSGSTGLLALIATVCLVGVGAAAVRTVAQQRSTVAR